jgi:hypothetical protein
MKAHETIVFPENRLRSSELVLREMLPRFSTIFIRIEKKLGKIHKALCGWTLSQNLRV